mgnify:CR=1 FL=1
MSAEALPDFFAAVPAIVVADPLAALLGAAAGGRLEYRYADAVRLAGHSCPTVAGAWLMARKALAHLYADDLPQRGGLQVALRQPLAEGVTALQQQIRMLARGDRSNFHHHLMVDHVEVNGKTLGLIGYGNIARETIKVAQALGMNILVATRTLRPDVDGIHFTTNDEVFERSDFISLHCPLNAATRHLVNQQTLAMMKPTAYVINTARGALIDEAALIEALRTGVIAGAGLDVFVDEPHVPPTVRLSERVTLQAHRASATWETRAAMGEMVLDSIAQALRGERPALSLTT